MKWSMVLKTIQHCYYVFRGDVLRNCVGGGEYEATALFHDRHRIGNNFLQLGGGEGWERLLCRDRSPKAQATSVFRLDLTQIIDLGLYGLVAIQSDLDEILEYLLYIAT